METPAITIDLSAPPPPLTPLHFLTARRSPRYAEIKCESRQNSILLCVYTLKKLSLLTSIAIPFALDPSSPFLFPPSRSLDSLAGDRFFWEEYFWRKRKFFHSLLFICIDLDNGRRKMIGIGRLGDKCPWGYHPVVNYT